MVHHDVNQGISSTILLRDHRVQLVYGLRGVVHQTAKAAC